MRSTKYQVYVSGTPRQGKDAQAAGAAAPIQGDGAGFGAGAGTEAPYATVNPSAAPTLRRFPPVLQFLTQTDALIEQQIWTLATQAHRKGLTLQQICEEIYYHARALGYEAALGVQEVYSAGMPSFPGQTVMSALVLVDLKRIQAPEGFHRGRVS